MSASDYAAWYGAAVATAVLLWDYVKWRESGPQVRAEARAGWRTLGSEDDDQRDKIFVKATNIGDRATTLTSWGLYWYPEGVGLRDKASRRAFMIKGGLSGSGAVPSKLNPGDVWMGISLENDEVKKLLATGTCYMALGFSHADDEVLVRVISN